MSIKEYDDDDDHGCLLCICLLIYNDSKANLSALGDLFSKAFPEYFLRIS